MPDSTSQSLYLVSNELNSTLSDAGRALEDFVDGRDGPEALHKCAELLHLSHGALKMVEIYSAALLAEEMELACLVVAEIVNKRKSADDGLEALSRAMVQLPGYLDRMLSGGRDIALVLLPLLNDLRAVRGKPLLSENTLLLLNLSSNRQPSAPATATQPAADLSALARRIRPAFQLALLGWIRGQEPDNNLSKMSQIASVLEQAATTDSVYQLWWVSGGVLEALRNGGLETTASVKRLLGQVDRQIKRLIDSGEIAADAEPALDLLNNLLYYVGRSTNTGERVTAIRSAFRLTDVLPGDEQVEHARESLSAPSVKLMKTVGAAIKEDLASVKDTLDIFVRTGMDQVDELIPQLDMLKKISDTLGVLGLGGLRADIQSEISELQGILSEEAPSDDAKLVHIAATLLRVEDNLDQQLIRLIVPSTDDEADFDDDFATDTEFRQVTQAVARECIVNLARVKDAITQALSERPNPRALDEVGPQLRGITAGLLLLNKTRAVRIIEGIGQIIASRLNRDARSLTTSLLDRLADAIVSVEYYIETVQSGRRDPWYMLDNAESCLEVLRKLERRELDTEEEEVDAVEEGYARTVQLEGPARHRAQMPPDPQATEILIEHESPPVMSKRTDTVDPELLEIFIEEAKEEIASVNRYFPAWFENPEDSEALITVRRSFHTLKGSGRMVGAQMIGEYAWSIENLLNRLINQTLNRTPQMVMFLENSVAVLPELIEQLEVGTEPEFDVQLFMKQAEAFAEGDPEAAKLTSGSIRVPVLDEEALEAAADQSAQMDPVLKDIFSKETKGHLAVIEKFLKDTEDKVAPYAVSEDLYRACHTLSGSANMAGVQQAVAVANPLERYIGNLLGHERGLPDEGRSACAEVVAAMRRIITELDRAPAASTDFSELVERITALEASLEPLIAAEAPATPSATQETPAAAEDAGFDPDIARIFAEEAAEILEASDEALVAWSKAARDRQRLIELQRHLHTLKGGARMAGIGAMGDLSHEVETLLSDLIDERLAPDQAVKDALQHSLDVLHGMRDRVNAGQQVAAVPELIAQIEGLLSGRRDDGQGEAVAPEDEFVDEGTSVLPALGRPGSGCVEHRRTGRDSGPRC